MNQLRLCNNCLKLSTPRFFISAIHTFELGKEDQLFEPDPERDLYFCSSGCMDRYTLKHMKK